MIDRTQAPAGCRQSLTTAITVFVGFSLTFLRAIWSSEARQGWNAYEIACQVTVIAGTLVQVGALFRALDVNADIGRYRKTVRIFQAGLMIVIVGAVVAVIIH